ncbi:MAG: hypothetical protein B6I22_10200 [Desulfobacteraceae bacterium 4572_123]|nr:MAG: hypothetical protein B6I22_10200 [Desulfobacteraceae bacterium 4572_123]
MGIKILGPDIHTSDVHWYGRGKTMRTGLIAVKGLSLQTMQRIVAEGRRKRFGDFSDFLKRVRPDQTEARALILCGALDVFAAENSRAGLLWHLARRQAPASHGAVQKSLFKKTDRIPPPALPPDNRLDRLRREFAVLGFLCACHPMELYAAALKKLDTVKAALLPTLTGRRVRLAAWLITGKKVRTRQGDTMKFLTFEDETGIVETTFFPKVYHRFCHMLDLNRPYILTGRVEQDRGAVTLTVDRVDVLPENRFVMKDIKHASVFPETPETFSGIQNRKLQGKPCREIFAKYASPHPFDLRKGGPGQYDPARFSRHAGG